MSDRVVVFVDYQNVHGWARRQFHPGNVDPAIGHISPLRLGQLLVARRKRSSELEGVRVGPAGRGLGDRDSSAAANDRQTVEWERSGNVTVLRRPLRYPGDWPKTPAVEKGVDVALAIDLVRMTMTKACDAAVVVSSDTDLMPAIEMVTTSAWLTSRSRRGQGPTACASRTRNSRGATTSASSSTGPSRIRLTTRRCSC